MSNVEKINFKITFAEPVSEQEVIEGLGLTMKIKNTNMVAFNSENMIKRYETLKEMIDEWFDVRYDVYERRRIALIKEMEVMIRRLFNKCRFIREKKKKIIDVKNKSKQQIISMLDERKYDKLTDKSNDEVLGYDYLLNMKIYSLTKEKFEELQKKLNDLQKKLEDYKKLTIEDIWLSELNELEKAL